MKLNAREAIGYAGVAVFMVPTLFFRGLGRRASEWVIIKNQKILRKLSLRRHNRQTDSPEDTPPQNGGLFCTCFPRRLFKRSSKTDLNIDDNCSYIDPFIHREIQCQNSTETESSTGNDIAISIHHIKPSGPKSNYPGSPVISIRSIGSLSAHIYENPNELNVINLRRFNESLISFSPILRKRLPSHLAYQLPKDDITHYSVILEDGSSYKIPINSNVDHPYQIMPNVCDWSVEDIITKKPLKKKKSSFSFPHIYNSPFSTLNRITLPLKKRKKKTRKKKTSSLTLRCCHKLNSCESLSNSSQCSSHSEVLVYFKYVGGKPCKTSHKKSRKSKTPAFIRFSPSSRTSCKYYLDERKSKLIRNKRFSTISVQTVDDVEPKKTFSISSGNNSISKTRNVEEEEYYFDITRERAREILINGCQGDFLIRPSKRSDDHKYTLCIQNRNSITNLPIREKPNKKYTLGSKKANGEIFNSIQELVERYKREPLTIANKASCLLGNPPVVIP